MGRVGYVSTEDGSFDGDEGMPCGLILALS